MKKLALLGLVSAFSGGLGLQAQDTDPDFEDLDPVAVLISHASRGETLLIVDWIGTGRVDWNIVVEDRDHGWRDLKEVSEIRGRHLILKAPLERPYYPGTRLHQKR